MRTSVFVLACVLWHGTTALAQPRTPADPVDALVRSLEQVLNSVDRAAFPGLFASTVSEDSVRQHGSDLFYPGAIRTALFERSRGPLEGAPPGDGYRLVIEVFLETRARARILTAGVDVRRPPAGGPDSWRISSIDSMSAIDGLHRLQLNTSTPQAVRNLELRSEDVIIALPEGLLFPIECDQGVTGMVLIGRGELRFSPAPATERGQLRVFAGVDSLNAPFETAYIRINPADYGEQIATATLTASAADARTVRRALDVFARESPRTFAVDVADMSRASWHLLPPPDDLVAEVDTRRHGSLTYLRSGQQAEDVSLFRRSDRKTITLYPSVAKLAARGRFYSDDSSREYDVLDYAITASIDPQRRVISGRARLSTRIRSTSVPTLLIRLADSLAVSAVSSVEYGRLLHIRLQGQNLIAVNMPRPAQQDSDLTLVIDYAGPLESQDADIDMVQSETRPGVPGIPFESKYLLSGRAYWYPQNPIPDYATATLRLSVPNAYRVVASGEPVTAPLAVQAGQDPVPGTQTFLFRANQPLRYLAFVASRMTRVAEKRIEFSDDGPGVGPISITVDATSRVLGRGRASVQPAEDILRFYTTIVGDAPYASAAVVLSENDLPGGHSPAYFALVNEPPPPVIPTWRGDPAAFLGFPDFFLAHELAHQWWGQAVAWKNYHEQWLAEGFAQYFAAMYAQKSRGERVFVDMLRQFHRWSIDESSKGPVYLGYRLGHLQSDPRVYRALVYNKGAAVLHMLRRLLGDEPFFRGIRLFYQERRYQKAGTEDLERAMEIASGRVLDRFFERWIYNAELPRVTYRSKIGEKGVTVEFEQAGTAVFDLPVTVRLVLVNGQTLDVVVPLSDRQVVRTIPADGPVREVQINRDFGALAEFVAR
jgi:hypothetical protein